MPHTIFLIFGSTGDLARRYLFPSLYQIDKNHDITVVAVGRRDFSDTEFQEYIHTEWWQYFREEDHINEFIAKIRYKKIEIDSSDDYENLVPFIDG